MCSSIVATQDRHDKSFSILIGATMRRAGPKSQAASGISTGLDGDPLYFVQGDLFLAAVVELGGAGRFVVGDVLGRAICFSGRITSPPRSVQQGSNSG